MSEPWYGWLRRDACHNYQRVVGPCSTLAECSRQLGEEARRRGILDRHTMMTTGSYPRDTRLTPTATQETLSTTEPPRPSTDTENALETR